MANIGAYSRHKFLDELNSPLFTNNGDGAVPLVYSPDEQKLKVVNNMGQAAAAVGTVSSGVTASEFFLAGGARLAKLSMTAKSLGTAGDGAALAIGAQIYAFPAGDILVTDAAMVGTFAQNPTSTGYTNAMDFGLGTVVGSGVVAVLGGTATFENIIGGTTSANLTTTPISGNATQVVAAGSINPLLIPAASVHTVFMNTAGTWTDVTTAAPIEFTGFVYLKYTIM